MSVFQVGDVVYHAIKGKGKITSIDDEPLPCFVKYDSGSKRWTQEELLSFSPWPKPNHERPLDEGLYLVTCGNKPRQLLAAQYDGDWYYADGGEREWCGNNFEPPEGVKVVKFLHHLPKN